MQLAQVQTCSSLRPCTLAGFTVSHKQPVLRAAIVPRMRQAHRRACMIALPRASTQEVSAEEQGQISSQLMQKMKNSITESLEAEKAEVTDVYGDGRHVSIEVVSKMFEGQSSVKRQRLVYKVASCSLYSLVSVGLRSCDVARCFMTCRQSGKSYKIQSML